MSIRNVSLEKSLKVFPKPFGLKYMFAKDLFIFPTENIQKITPSHEKELTLQKPVRILKRIIEY